MKAILAAAAVVLLALAPVIWAPRDRMRAAVEAFGFDHVTIGSFSLFGCGKDDVFRRSWRGRDRAGRAVSGAVCGGVFRGYSVRLQG